MYENLTWTRKYMNYYKYYSILSRVFTLVFVFMCGGTNAFLHCIIFSIIIIFSEYHEPQGIFTIILNFPI